MIGKHAAYVEIHMYTCFCVPPMVLHWNCVHLVVLSLSLILCPFGASYGVSLEFIELVPIWCLLGLHWNCAHLVPLIYRRQAVPGAMTLPKVRSAARLPPPSTGPYRRIQIVCRWLDARCIHIPVCSMLICVVRSGGSTLKDFVLCSFSVMIHAVTLMATEGKTVADAIHRVVSVKLETTVGQGIKSCNRSSQTLSCFIIIAFECD